MSEKRRIVTAKARIKSITSGRFVSQEGFNPNYVLAGGRKLARVRILGTIVDKYVAESGKFASLTLDDGSDTIRVKVFNALSMFEGVDEGDIIDVIGRTKEYQGEVYVLPETVNRVGPDMEMLRDLELQMVDKGSEKKKELARKYKHLGDDAVRALAEHGIPEEEAEALMGSLEGEGPDKDLKEDVLELIEKLDSGEGCDYSKLIESAEMEESDVESAVEELLAEGSCFEPRPGKIKKL